MAHPHALGSLTCLSLVLLAGAGGCIEGEGEESADEVVAEAEQALGGHGKAKNKNGKKLFEKETFGGNGRTCSTCHTGEAGTISLEQINERFEADPDDPLFRSIDSNDGAGDDYSRLLEDGTFRVTIDLPPNIRLADDPGATTFTVNRGTPTFWNVAALDPVLNSDGSATNLQDQALGAVRTHYEASREPTAEELDKIADFQERFFSSPKLRAYANGGPTPKIPNGSTASEKRGRAFFNPDGLCGSCHSGPLLDTTSEFEFFNGVGPGERFGSVFAGFLTAFGVGDPDDAPNPIRVWNMDCPEGGSFLCDNAEAFGGFVDENNTITIAFPDLGRPLVTGDIDSFIFFKIPTMWGVAQTAPYFHDNSAKTLDDVLIHYDTLFSITLGQGLSPQDQEDIKAFLTLL